MKAPSKSKPRYYPDSKKVKEVQDFEDKRKEDMKEPSKSKPVKPVKKAPVDRPKPVQDSYRDEPLPDMAKRVKSAPEGY